MISRGNVILKLDKSNQRGYNDANQTNDANDVKADYNAKLQFLIRETFLSSYKFC